MSKQHYTRAMIGMMLIFALTATKTVAQTSNDCPIDVTSNVFNDYPLVCELYVNKPYDSRKVFYLNWNKGDLYFEDGHILKGILIRYDQMEDIVIWMRPDDYKFGIVRKDLLKAFTLYEKETDIPHHFEKRSHIRPTIAESYAEVLNEGFLSIYLSHKVLTDNSSNDLINNDRYYAFINNDYKSFSLNRLRFMQLLSKQYKKEMRLILRKNNLIINRKRPNDIVKAVEIFNEAHKTDSAMQ